MLPNGRFPAFAFVEKLKEIYLVEKSESKVSDFRNQHTLVVLVHSYDHTSHLMKLLHEAGRGCTLQHSSYNHEFTHIKTPHMVLHER